MLPILTQGLFPVTCQLCRQPGQWCCDQHRPFQPAPANRVQYHHLDAIWAATAYQDPGISKLIESFKFRHCQALAPTLADLMIEALPESAWQNEVLIPIPLHWRRQWWRGFNQSQCLAQSIQKQKHNLQLQSRWLKRQKSTQQQARLSKAERQHNVQSAFVATPQVAGKAIILIDDVVASGSTLDEAARVLKSAGAKRITAVVLARGG